MPSSHRSIAGHRAFTLVEAVVSVAVMGIRLVSAVQMISVAAKARSVKKTQQQGLQLARELLTEIMEAHYSLPSGMTDGSTRQTWILIDDYNGLSENPPTSQAGVALAGYAGWKRGVAVDFVSILTPDTSSGSDQGLKRIVITVTPPTGSAITLSGIRASTGLVEHRPSSSFASYTSWVDVAIDAGSGNGGKVYSGSDLINQVP